MPRNVSLSLTGKPNTSGTILSGNKIINSNNYIPSEIATLKINIMNTIILPFNSKNWKILEENLVFIDIIKEKLLSFESKYPHINLQMYNDLVEAYESTIYLHMEVINLETQMYGLNNGSANMLIKTVMLRLKPELELYNLIIGRPKFNLGETYDTTITNKILLLLQIENITFEQIKNNLITNV